MFNLSFQIFFELGANHAIAPKYHSQFSCLFLVFIRDRQLPYFSIGVRQFVYI